jgi:beta-glucosidase
MFHTNGSSEEGQQTECKFSLKKNACLGPLLIVLDVKIKRFINEGNMNHFTRNSCMRAPAILFLGFAFLAQVGIAQRPQPKPHPTGPWMNTSLSPDERADLVMKEMTVDEKIALLHGVGMPTDEPVTPENAASNRGVGYVVGVPRLGIPGIDMSDAAYGVRSSGVNGRYATALPADVAAAASWDTNAAYEYGALIGRELRAQGYNMTLGGGVNLTRDPRNGRTFEYLGEDPILAGTLVARLIQGTQSADVIGDIKHYALNDQESGRNSVNINISKRAARESDLLAFEIGVEQGKPAAVMCSYHRVNGDFACENKWLLTDVLKKDWKFPGFVLSDWGGTHSDIKASAAGLDNEEPGHFFFDERFKAALDAGKIPESELDDHVHRILRSMFAAGVIDHPRQRSVVDPFAGFEISRKIEEGGIVLLKNEKAALPLSAAKLHTIAVIGSHSDVGMISGGGSAQVDPIGGNAIMPPGKGATHWMEEIWFPTSPLKAIQARAPHATVKYDPGTDPASAAAAAKGADVAIVFAYMWASEGHHLGARDRQPGDVAVGAKAGGNSGGVVCRKRWRGCRRQCAVRISESQRKAAKHFPEERSRPPASDDHDAAARVGALLRAGITGEVGNGPSPVPGDV